VRENFLYTRIFLVSVHKYLVTKQKFCPHPSLPPQAGEGDWFPPLLAGEG